MLYCQFTETSARPSGTFELQRQGHSLCSSSLSSSEHSCREMPPLSTATQSASSVALLDRRSLPESSKVKLPCQPSSWFCILGIQGGSTR